jgi:hypothetical protein
MRKLIALAAALFVVSAAQPEVVFAQQSKAKQGKVSAKDNNKMVNKTVQKNDRDDDVYRRVNTSRGDGDIYRGTYNTKNSKGPAFCRSGAGHPVHGRQWCVNKGFGLGGSRWDRGNWDVIFRESPRSNMDVGRSVLSDVLGSVIFNRLDARRQTFGVTQPLWGRWIDAEGRSVLMVNAGRTPIAELVDSNRDRRVDLVLLNYR